MLCMRGCRALLMVVSVASLDGLAFQGIVRHTVSMHASGRRCWHHTACMLPRRWWRRKPYRSPSRSAALQRAPEAGSVAMAGISLLLTPWAPGRAAAPREHAAAPPAAARALSCVHIGVSNSPGALATATLATHRVAAAAPPLPPSPPTPHIGGRLSEASLCRFPPSFAGRSRGMRAAAAAGGDIVPRGPEREFFQAVRLTCLIGCAIVACTDFKYVLCAPACCSMPLGQAACASASAAPSRVASSGMAASRR